MNNLANTLVAEGHLAEALELQQEALGARSSVSLDRSTRTRCGQWRSLAETLQREGRYSEAEKLQRQTLEIQRRVLGPDRPNTLETMSSLAVTLNKEGRYSEAERLQRRDGRHACAACSDQSTQTR